MRYLHYLGLMLSIFLCCRQVMAQKNTYRGVCLDEDTSTPVPFVSIYDIKGGLISVANSRGEFIITISSDSSSLVLRCIGYDQRKLENKELEKDKINTILLAPKLMVLPEVIVLPEKLIEFQHGYNNVPDDFKTYTFGQLKYMAIGSMIKLKKGSGRLERARIYVGENKIGKFTFRCRIANINKSKLPGDDLLKTDILLSSDIESGWVDFDLSPLNYWIDENKIYLIVEVLHDFIINDNNIIISIGSPGMAYVPNKRRSCISTQPGVWRKDNKEFITSITVSYEN